MINQNNENKITLKRNENNYEHLFSSKHIALATIISLLNSFFYDNFPVMILLVIIESILLLKTIIKKQYMKYLCYYMIFLSTSMESATFVGTEAFYGFKNFKIAGINLGAIFLVLLLVVLLSNGTFNKIFKIRGKIAYFVKGAITLTCLALFMGLVSILINDNSISQKMSGMMMFIDSAYIYFFVAFEIIVITVIIENNKGNTMEIKRTLMALIISLSITLIFSLILENYGNRGGLPSLQVSNLIMLLIASIVIPFYKVINKKVCIGMASVVILVLGLIYNTNGKMIIIAMLLPIIIMAILVRNKKYKLALFLVFISFFLILVLNNMIIPIIKTSSPLFAIKLEQATSLLSFWKKDWLLNMPDSPKIRIAQFMNITAEYLNKPGYLVLGKGYMGTIQDHLNMFSNINEFTYSEWELNNNLYYMMHETLNNLYLTNGLLGVLYFAFVLRVIISNIIKSPWIVLGGLWFVLFYSYSLTISIFGASAFIVGLYDIRILSQNDKIN